MRSLPLCFVLAAAALPLGGCAERVAENALERQLPQILGPAESYQVNVEGVRGAREARRVQVTGNDVRLEGSPTIHRLHVTLRDVVYDRERGDLERVGSAEAVAEIREPAIEAHLEQDPRLEDVSVDLLAPNRVVVQAHPRLPQVNLPESATVAVSGRLAGQADQVRFLVDDVRAAGITLPAAVGEWIAEAVNPVAVLPSRPVPLQVQDVRVEADVLIVRAVKRGAP